MKIVFKNNDDLQIIADVDWFGYTKPIVAQRNNAIINRMIENFPRFYHLMESTLGDDNYQLFVCKLPNYQVHHIQCEEQKGVKG